MSDLRIALEALERSRSQLSVSSYFDDDLFRRENNVRQQAQIDLAWLTSAFAWGEAR